MKRKPEYDTEAALCADFIAWVKRGGGDSYRDAARRKWTPYAETAGWDILLVADDGTQIGVQAKLRLNLKVLDQTIPSCWDAWHDKGPDHRAILVPDTSNDYGTLCNALGIILFHPRGRLYDEKQDFLPAMDGENWNGQWHDWWPLKRETLPEFVPDVVAGASGPVQLTTWKVAALRVVATLEIRGYVTRKDFEANKIDPRRWMNGWLVPGETRGCWIRGKLDFDKQHPDVYAQVLDEVRARLAGEQRPGTDLLGTPLVDAVEIRA